MALESAISLRNLVPSVGHFMIHQYLDGGCVFLVTKIEEKASYF